MHSKVEKVIQNCLECIMATKKVGRQERLLHLIDKKTPLDISHRSSGSDAINAEEIPIYSCGCRSSQNSFGFIHKTRNTNTAEVLDHLIKQPFMKTLDGLFLIRDQHSHPAVSNRIVRTKALSII